MTEKTTKQLLDEPIPSSAVSKRKAFARGGQDVYLDYLEGWYVIDRLNRVIGQGNWSFQSDPQEAFRSFDDKSGYWNVVYTCKGDLHFQLDSQLASRMQDIGTGDGKDKSLAKAIESASKEAVTDSLKRCAKNLGMSMGLALYDKTKEFVTDGAEVEAKPELIPLQPAPVPQPEPVQAEATEAQLREIIQKTAKIVLKKEILTKDSIKAELSTKFGVDKLQDVALVKLPEVRKWIESYLH